VLIGKTHSDTERGTGKSENFRVQAQNGRGIYCGLTAES